jgi:hypothetical protein
MTATLGLLAIVLALGMPSDCWAWGDEGHKVICEIAFRLAQPTTRAEIRKLISTDERFTSFSDSCTWPDHPRQRSSEHFLNLPRDSDGLHSETCRVHRPRSRNRLDHGSRIGDGAEHAALHLDHLERRQMVALVGGARAVLQDKAFEAAIVGLAHNRVARSLPAENEKLGTPIAHPIRP